MIKSLLDRFIGKENRGAIRISGVYLLTSAVWILWSDRLAARLAPDPETLTRISITKGWGFVLLTTLLLFLLIRRYTLSLQAEQVYVRLIYEAMPASLAYLDSNLRYRFNNRAYEDWFGRSRGEVYGMSPAEVFEKNTYENIRGYLHDALAGKRCTFETTIPHADGRMRASEVTYIPDIRQDGRVHGLVVVAVDIDDRKRNEEALRNSENHYRLLAENIADVVWVLDAKSLRFTYVSPSVERLRGFTVEEVLAQTIEEVMTPESLAVMQADLPARLAAFFSGEAEAKTQTHEIEQYRKDGTIVWTEVVTTLIENASGGIEVLGVTRDLTERKRAEKALSEREAQYRAVIETSSDGFCIMDLQGNILEVNQAYIELSRTSREELLKMNIQDLTVQDSPDRQADQATSAVHRGNHIYETRQVCKNGDTWQVEVLVSYWPIHGGRLFAFLRDIRKRKRSEALLRSRLQLSEMGSYAGVNEMLQYTLDQAEAFTGSRIGFFHRVEEDQTTLSLQLWSLATTREVCQVAEPQMQMHYPVDQAGIWTDCLFTRAPVIFNDYANQTHRKGLPEGHAPLTRILTIPILENEKVSAILGVGNKAEDYTQEDVEVVQELFSMAMDVVARKQAEEAAHRYAAELEQRVAERTTDLRRANAELEQASRAKDEFLAGVSHELRTPLNAIITLTESLQEGAYEPISERQQKPLHTIAESGYHLLNLINDLLDLSKIEAGKLGLQIAPADIEPICQASLRMVRQQAHNKNLKMSFTIDPALRSVQTDSRRLKQMLVNLLGNAVKFTPPGGQIGLEVRADPKAGALRMTVWDSGIGIAAEDARRLFQPFVQVDSGLDRQYGGTGLGLSLVYRMAELHGGSVSVESKPGEGSSFTISLPWEGGAKDPFGTRPLRPLLAPEIQRVLVVGAPAPLAEQLRRYLNELGLQADLAAGSAGALAIAGEAPPDVIVLDRAAAGEGSKEALAQLEQAAFSRSIPVILLSDMDEMEPGTPGQVSGYLMKPVTRQRLVDALWKTVNKPEEPSPAGDQQALILIAEHNPATQAAYGDHLAASGYRVAFASNGPAAVERAREVRPDLILVNLQISEMDGLEVARRLRANPLSEATPIIGITALSIPGDRERSLLAGVNEYLVRPVSLKLLAQTIEAWQSRGTA